MKYILLVLYVFDREELITVWLGMNCGIDLVVSEMQPRIDLLQNAGFI